MDEEQETVPARWSSQSLQCIPDLRELVHVLLGEYFGAIYQVN